jgi:hypothetical protein
MPAALPIGVWSGEAASVRSPGFQLALADIEKCKTPNINGQTASVVKARKNIYHEIERHPVIFVQFIRHIQVR